MGRKSKKAVETGFITEVDRYLFGNGTHYEIYDKLGAHPWTFRGKSGYYFAVWAPHAQSVSLVGDFNNWNPDSHPMKLLEDSGIYELFVPDMGKGQLYKYAITTQSGQLIFKADPYAFSAEFRPGTASITSDIAGFSWKDGKWMAARPEKAMEKEPVSIYEVHLGSWRKKDRQIKEGFYIHIKRRLTN